MESGQWSAESGTEGDMESGVYQWRADGGAESGERRYDWSLWWRTDHAKWSVESGDVVDSGV